MTPSPDLEDNNVNESNAPLPCPFCGHVGLTFGDGSTHRWGLAWCAGCSASAGEVRRTYPDDGSWRAYAIKQWNKRAAIQAPEGAPDLRQALEQIVATLGPKVPDCIKCLGCAVEWSEALRTAQDALAAQPQARVALTDDNKRMDWLAERLLGADWSYGEPAICVWLIETDAAISADLRASIDAAMLAVPQTEEPTNVN